MDFIKHHIALIEKEIETIPFPQQPSNLYDPCRYIFKLGGKRIRPVLTLLAHELYDNNSQKAVPAALTVETFHNFSLIHDDIMDNAPLRRGMPTVHTKWNTTIGILSGDVMLVHCYKLLTDHYSGEELTRLLKVFNRTAAEVCDGQQMDMDFETRKDVSIDEYIHMISLKTSVLLGCALKMGAITAAAPAEDAAHLYEFGKNVGIAFQLQDDYLDTFGDSSKTGKQPGGDILAGKKTALVIECMEAANENDKVLLDETLHGQSSDKIERVLALFQKYKIADKTRKLVEQYSQEAIQHLHKIEVDQQKKQSLVSLTDFLLNRQH